MDLKPNSPLVFFLVLQIADQSGDARKTKVGVRGAREKGRRLRLGRGCDLKPELNSSVHRLLLLVLLAVFDETQK